MQQTSKQTFDLALKLIFYVLVGKAYLKEIRVASEIVGLNLSEIERQE
jgi:hypothetical protein